MVSGLGDAALRDALTQIDPPLTPDQVAPAIAEGRRRITLAADYHRDHEIGRAITRLNDLYRRALAAQDIKHALAAQRELTKLFDLARPPTDAAGPANEEAAAIRRHLEPLDLAEPGTPTVELCRLAVGRIIDLEAAANAP